MTLQEAFRTPQDFDGAEFLLGVMLGLWEDGHESFFEHKWVFWSNNPLGNALAEMLQQLVGAGVLVEGDGTFAWREGFALEKR